jgi:hypothetical protein
MQWWVFTVKQQQKAKPDDALAIQVKLTNGCPSCWSQPNEMKAIGVPGEVLMPIVLPWMEERNRPTCSRIGRISFVVFGSITSLTG